jgi:hypothetical protein
VWYPEVKESGRAEPWVVMDRASGLRQRVITQVLTRARSVFKAAGGVGPPYSPDRYAAVCRVIEIRRTAGIGDTPEVRPARPSGRDFVVTLDRRLPPHTAQWNGALALALARTLLPAGVTGPSADMLAEIGAAELLLPMQAFHPVAARTDLTMDGLRELAFRFGAPIRLTARQWLRAGLWRGYALLWRNGGGTLRLAWRAASPNVRYPRTLTIGTPAAAVWRPESRLYATFSTGRPHHGVEEIRTGAGSAWWFIRFGVVRDAGPSLRASGVKAVLALVTLARGG